MIMNRPPKPPPRRSSLAAAKHGSEPAVCASMVTAPASVAAMELVRMSRLQHVAEFVGEHAFQFFVIQQIENALGYGDSRVAGVAAGCKGVRRINRYDVDPWHRPAPCGAGCDP